MIGLTYLAYKTFVNFSQGAKGIEAIPFISELKFITGWLLKLATKAFQKLSKSSHNSNTMNASSKNRPRRKEDEEANEFNIKNMNEISKTDNDFFDENKYGTI